MATAEAELRVPAQTEESTGARMLRYLSKLPVQIFLVLVGLLWLVPTFGLLITSLLSPADFTREGLVAGLLRSEQADLGELRRGPAQRRDHRPRSGRPC